jgi:hypothetical protein
MPKHVAKGDRRFEAAAGFVRKYRSITVKHAMKLADFSDQEQACRAMQMVVHRLLDKTKSSNITTPPPSSLVVSIGGTPVSSVTNSSGTNEEAVVVSLTAPKLKRIRLSTNAAQEVRARQLDEKRKVSDALKRATMMYHRERQKTDGGMSAQEVADKIEEDTGVKVSKRTIQHKVKNGNVGTSPLRRGPKGNIPDRSYRDLCLAYESYITIQQLKGAMRNCRPKRVGPLLQKTIFGHSDNWQALLERVQKDTATNLRRQKAKKAEDRRLKWTTKKNLVPWFDNWEQDLVALGFGTRDETGAVYIPPEQQERIANLDETCLNLDGSSAIRGGRPDCVMYDPRFPVVGLATTKSSSTSTLITGSTAAGEVLPPHIQFPTKAKSADTERINIDVIQYVQKVRGKFGCAEVRTWPITFGMNETGGMDAEEFEEYLMNSIVPLFPDVSDVPGKRVILKVDSGPGRSNLKLLARLRLLGIYLYPCVPNTTHVTQETDQCYGPFKTQFISNLELIVDGKLDENKSLSVTPSMVGLPLFGGVDSDTGVKVATGAFQHAFVRSRCLAAWRKVGAVAEDGRITRACLNNPQVLTELGDDKDMDLLYYAVQNANDIAVLSLHNAGYDAQWLTATLNKKKEEETVCVPYSPSRVERLANARGHGGRFHATKGGHLTADDIFIAGEMKLRKEEREIAEKDKKVRQQQQMNEEKALAILSNEGVDPASYGVAQLNTLLAWHQVSVPPKSKKADKLARWRDIVASKKAPPTYAKWTDEDEQRLVALQSNVIGIGDTALGREIALRKKECEAATLHFSREERRAMIQKLTDMDAAEAGETRNEAVTEGLAPV